MKYIELIGKILIVVIVLCAIAFGIYFYFQNPVIEITGEQIMKVPVTEKYIEPGAKAYYRFKEYSNEINSKSNIDTSKIGTYKVTYNVEIDNKEATAERIVQVVDELNPMLVISGKEKEVASSLELFQEPGFRAEDNYDGDISANVNTKLEKISDNIYKKIYLVTDSSGNIGTAERTIEIKDIVPPVISLKGTEVENIYVGGTYNESGFTATDDLDGDISNKVLIEGSVDTSKVGSYIITYTAKDNSGNITSVQRRVQVLEVPETTGIVYLTFDDGPSETITPKVLDILKDEGVKATFFILNYTDSTEYLVKRIVNEGHSIGLHGYSHDYSTIYQSEKTSMENITKLEEKIKASTGVDTKLTRFPGGSSNTVSSYNPGIMTRLTQRILNEGYRYFDWNVSSEDAGGAKTSGDVYMNVTNGISHNRTTNVVLMHDFASNTKTLNALRDIIRYCKNNGYKLDKITDSTPMITHRINN